METFIIVAYCASDDVKKKIGIEDNIQTNVGVAQIMTACLVAAKYFGTNESYEFAIDSLPVQACDNIRIQ